jgi:hypothetical protein
MKLVSTVGGVLSFMPNKGSYFYETFPCIKAQSEGYKSVSFLVMGPIGGSLVLEIQTKSSCDAGPTSATTKWFTISGLTGASQTVTVPLSSFTGASLDAVTAFVWAGFSSTSSIWLIDNVRLNRDSSAAGE